MVVVGLVGEMRSGKTLLMTLLLHDDNVRGKEVIANYHLNFNSEVLDVNALDESIRGGDTDYFKDKSIGIDEIHVFMDSRGSGQKRNKMMSYFLTQSGKLDTTVYWTSQFLRQVDVRLRLNTQILYKCERYSLRNGKKYALRQDDKREEFCIDAHKHFLKDTPKGLMYVYEKTLTIKNPKKYYSLYDTKERVYYEDTLEEREKKDKEKKRLLGTTKKGRSLVKKRSLRS